MSGCAAASLLDGNRLGSRPKLGKTTDEKKTNQLVVHADFDLPPEHRMIRELADEREQVNRILALPEGREPIHLYLFAEESSYRSHVREQFPDFPDRRAIFVETDVQLAVYAHWGDHIAEDLRHETAHGYLHDAVPELPLWLDEGLAEYFEVSPSRHGLNRPHVELLSAQQAAGAWRPDMQRLESLTSAASMTQRDYAESWLWVHWLLDSETGSAALKELLADLRSRKPGAPLSRRLAAVSADPQAAVVSHLSALVASPEVR